MELQCVVVGMRSWNFIDEATGKTVIGGSLAVAQKSTNSGHYGYSLSEIPVDKDSLTLVGTAADSLALSECNVLCRIEMRGKAVKPIVIGLEHV